MAKNRHRKHKSRLRPNPYDTADRRRVPYDDRRVINSDSQVLGDDRSAIDDDRRSGQREDEYPPGEHSPGQRLDGQGLRRDRGRRDGFTRPIQVKASADQDSPQDQQDNSRSFGEHTDIGHPEQWHESPDDRRVLHDDDRSALEDDDRSGQREDENPLGEHSPVQRLDGQGSRRDRGRRYGFTRPIKVKASADQDSLQDQHDNSRSFRERTDSWRPKQWHESPDERGRRPEFANTYRPGSDSNPKAVPLSERRRFRNNQFGTPTSSGFSRSRSPPNSDTLNQGRARWIEQFPQIVSKH
jgi:hypothetical protein